MGIEEERNTYIYKYIWVLFIYRSSTYIYIVIFGYNPHNVANYFNPHPFHFESYISLLFFFASHKFHKKKFFLKKGPFLPNYIHKTEINQLYIYIGKLQFILPKLIMFFNLNTEVSIFFNSTNIIPKFLYRPYFYFL
jgi:hypothetical protein